jgi:hypothetical protein
MLKKQGVKLWAGSVCIRIGDSCEDDNEVKGSIKCGEFLE